MTYIDNMPDLSMAALSAIADGVIIMDVNGIVIWANTAYENCSGYSLDELITKKTNIVLSGDQDSKFYEQLWNSIAAGNIWTGELWNKRKNGSQYLEERSITPVKNTQEVITHFVAITRDVTYQKKLNDQLNNAKRIEAIGQLTAGVAHNFNNKLASILGFADLAIDELRQYNNADLEDSLTEIITAGKVARDLVKQMMAFSVNTFSKPQAVDLHLAINQAVKTITATFPAEVHVVTNLENVPQVVLDPVRLHQMLISLAVNAKEAMHKHGELVFELGMQSLGNSNCSSCHEVISGEYVCISLRDNGRGILPRDLENIFMPFFTTRQHEGGTGMGLSALHGMLHDMGGHVMVDSAAGEFTEFKLLFPSSLTTDTSIREPYTASPHRDKSTKHFHILIVDDDVSVANFMAEMLYMKGYQVTKETNSLEAFKTFAANPGRYDLLITDQSMPQLSGTELVKRIHEIRQDLPVFLMTGYGETNFNEASGPFYTVLTKPFETNTLLDKINQL